MKIIEKGLPSQVGSVDIVVRIKGQESIDLLNI
jgi:hypothetical protein